MSARTSVGAQTAPDPLQRPKRGKYGAVATVVNGIRFASKREAERYGVLWKAQTLGVIADLETQVLYRFEINGVKIGRYRADFRYCLPDTGEIVVEDVKGYRVRDWSRTKNLMKALHGIEIREVR